MTVLGIAFSGSDLWLLSICGALIMAWIGYRLKLASDRHNSFAVAATAFRTAVLSAFEGVYPIPAQWPADIHRFLEEKFPDIQAAVATFQPHVRGQRKRKGFAKAWVDYYNAYGDDRCQCYHHYTPFSGTSIVDGKQEDHDNTKTYKDNFRHNVDNLLKYAKIT